MKNNPIISLLLATLMAAPLLAEEHAHEHEAPKTISTDELFTVECEHNIKHYTCDECRYELGLVKIDPSLIRSEANSAGLLKFESVEKHTVQTLLPMNGEIALNESTQARITPRVSGIVRAVHAEQGSLVEKGAVLFEIESAELGRAVGAYRKNKALAALALKNMEREKALVTKKLSPESDWIDAQMKYDEYRIELEASANELTVMGLDTKSIAEVTSDANVGKPGLLPVHAPQTGTVLEKKVTVGESVEPGRELMVVADMSTVWVWMSLYEQDLARLLTESKKDTPRVQIATLAFPERIFEGTIDLIGSTVDEGDRTVKVRVTLQNPDALLRPGMFCAATVVFEGKEQVIAVPKNAVVSDEGKSFVFRLIRDGFVLRTDVATGRTFLDSIEITGGLPEGEKIITEGAFVCKSDVLRAKMGAGCAD